MTPAASRISISPAVALGDGDPARRRSQRLVRYDEREPAKPLLKTLALLDIVLDILQLALVNDDFQQPVHRAVHVAMRSNFFHGRILGYFGVTSYVKVPTSRPNPHMYIIVI